MEFQGHKTQKSHASIRMRRLARQPVAPMTDVLRYVLRVYAWHDILSIDT